MHRSIFVTGPGPAQPETEKRRSPLVSIPPFGRGFSRHGVFRSDGGLGGARTSPHAPVHRLDEPTGLSLGMVASKAAQSLFCWCGVSSGWFPLFAATT